MKYKLSKALTNALKAKAESRGITIGEEVENAVVYYLMDWGYPKQTEEDEKVILSLFDKFNEG